MPNKNNTSTEDTCLYANYNDCLEAAKRGDGQALFEMGTRHWFGLDVERNDDYAIDYWRKSAARGHAGAMFCLGTCYFNGRNNEDNKGVDMNLKKVTGCWERAAALGHAYAQMYLGQYYYHGYRGEKDYGLAFNWMNEAAAQETTLLSSISRSCMQTDVV